MPLSINTQFEPGDTIHYIGDCKTFNGDPLITIFSDEIENVKVRVDDVTTSIFYTVIRNGFHLDINEVDCFATLTDAAAELVQRLTLDPQ